MGEKLKAEEDTFQNVREQTIMEEKRKREEILLQKQQEEERLLTEKQQEEESRKAEEKRKAELDAMSPEERDIAALSDPDISENQVVEIYNRIDAFSEENKKLFGRGVKFHIGFWIFEKWFYYNRVNPVIMSRFEAKRFTPRTRLLLTGCCNGRLSTAGLGRQGGWIPMSDLFLIRKKKGTG